MVKPAVSKTVYGADGTNDPARDSKLHLDVAANCFANSVRDRGRHLQQHVFARYGTGSYPEKPCAGSEANDEAPWLRSAYAPRP